jgi:hypothetical protein
VPNDEFRPFPLQISRLDFVLRETITFSYPSSTNSNRIIRSPPRVNTLFNTDASSSSDESAGFAVVYKNEPSHFALVGTVPSSHSRVTVRTAKVRFLPTSYSCLFSLS